ncbi:MAG: hypothetical protein ACOYEO_05495 [bacterium]|jgi:hypothetical protein
MTHSLHRTGSPEDLKDEVVFILSPSRGINTDGAEPKVKKFIEIMKKNGAVHYGDDLTGNVAILGHDQLITNATQFTNIHAVFADKQKAICALKDVVEADMGLSVVVTGLFDALDQCCQQAGVKFHTIEHSMGFWGRTEKLPSEDVLKIVTMCGHGLVAAGLVEKLVQDIKTGVITSEEAANEMARQCMCGIFNPVRAKETLDQMVKAL